MFFIINIKYLQITRTIYIVLLFFLSNVFYRISVIIICVLFESNITVWICVVMFFKYFTPFNVMIYDSQLHESLRDMFWFRFYFFQYPPEPSGTYPAPGPETFRNPPSGTRHPRRNTPEPIWAKTPLAYAVGEKAFSMDSNSRLQTNKTTGCHEITISGSDGPTQFSPAPFRSRCRLKTTGRPGVWRHLLGILVGRKYAFLPTPVPGYLIPFWVHWKRFQ